MGYIYLITNTVNNKQYIGQTICKDINSRWNQHKRKDAKTIGSYLLSAYIKYGIEKFKFKVICICFDEDCNRFEKEYITKYNTLAPNGYNLTPGGRNTYSNGKKKTKSKLTEETKAKISTSLRNVYLQNPHLKEMKKGENNHNYGKQMNDTQKEKIRSSMIEKYKEKSIAGKPKLSENAREALEKGRGHYIKPVGKFDLQGTLIEKYKSVSEAANKNNISRQHIGKVCNGNPKYKTAGGFIWKILSDDMIIS
jgi:group I intron endonuclease